jgi:hypothetical protein
VIDEIRAFLRDYTSLNGNPLPTVRDNISVPSSRIKIGPMRCPKMSVKYYHSTLHNTPKERRSEGSTHFPKSWEPPENCGHLQGYKKREPY